MKHFGGTTKTSFGNNLVVCFIKIIIGYKIITEIVKEKKNNVDETIKYKENETKRT